MMRERFSIKDQEKQQALFTLKKHLLKAQFEAVNPQQFQDRYEDLLYQTGSFTIFDSVKTGFQAKFTLRMKEDQKRAMYEEAGYTEEEVKGISGKGLAVSTGASLVLAAGSKGIEVGAVLWNEHIPLISSIPDTQTALTLALVTNLASYAAVTECNLHMTKKEGQSVNGWTTGWYALLNRLSPPIVRDMIARGFPQVLNAYVQTGVYSGAVYGVTNDASKAAAGLATGAFFNVVLAAGLFNRLKCTQIEE